MMTLIEFMQVHIIYRFNVLETITGNNGQPFKRAALAKLYAKYQIKGNIPHANTDPLTD